MFEAIAHWDRPQTVMATRCELRTRIDAEIVRTLGDPATTASRPRAVRAVEPS